MYFNKGCPNSLSFFAQAECVYPGLTAANRKTQGLAMSSLIVFGALIYMLIIDYVRRIAKLDFVTWDVKTVSAGDYTVEYEISQEAWDHFLATEYANIEGCKRSKARELRKYMKKELERYLTEEVPSQDFEEIDRVRIAQITFAFNNAHIVKMLKERGNFIKDVQFDKIREVEEKINAYKHENIYELNRPVFAFVSFESEEGLGRALALESVDGCSDAKFLE